MESRYARLDLAIEPILKVKGFACELARPSPHAAVLVSALVKIGSVHSLLHTLNARACTKYDTSNSLHEKKLLEV